MAKLFVTPLMTIAGAGCGTQAITTQTLATGLDSREARYCELRSQWDDCLEIPQHLRLSCASHLDTLDRLCESSVGTGLRATREECVEAEIDHWEDSIARENSIPFAPPCP